MGGGQSTEVAFVLAELLTPAALGLNHGSGVLIPMFISELNAVHCLECVDSGIS